MKRKMKLYVWHDALTDYTSGVIFALATSVREARKAVLKSQGLDESGRNPKYPNVGTPSMVWHEIQTEPEVVNKPKGFAVWGGG